MEIRRHLVRHAVIVHEKHTLTETNLDRLRAHLGVADRHSVPGRGGRRRGRHGESADPIGQFLAMLSETAGEAQDVAKPERMGVLRGTDADLNKKLSEFCDLLFVLNFFARYIIICSVVPLSDKIRMCAGL